MEEVKKTLAVDPEGDLLNDNDRGVDYLDYSVYSEALATLLQRAKPPITAGIFAPWGSGKSFLLNQVKGELLKRELQVECDIKFKEHSNKHGHHRNNTVEMSTQVDGHVNKKDKLEELDIRKTAKLQKRWKLKRRCAFISWTIVLSLIMAIMITALVFVFHQPSRDWLVSEYIMMPLSNKTIAENISSSSNQTKANTVDIIQTLDVEDDQMQISSNFRLWLIIVLVVSSFCVFLVFCCCISSTDSSFWQHFYSNFLLILYASFTRFPRGASSVAGVIFDDDVSLELNDSHEESTNGTTKRLETKYIFVNFHAWEYAGSDNLWAGIITTLSDAIEEQLGAVTTRIFRLLHVEETSKHSNMKVEKKNLIKDPCSIYVKLNEKAQSLDVREIMTKYGVVTYFCKLSIKSDGFTWWYIRYSQPSEANFSDEALSAIGIFVQRYKPLENPNFVTSQCHDIKEFRDVTDATEQYEEILHSNNGNSTSCGRFCMHFRRHPKTVCCRCPYLYMWIVFVISCIIFPILFCIFANKLELGLIQSSRIVPVEVQILSWIPATIGVLVIVIKFSWAMCNSQTTRIKRSLAGTRGNMATELGFMNEIKSEVMIMSKMIRCLRFTHNVNYKVIISIDDLDRCPPEKVKSVFEAISILLSDRTSPFICLVAVDSRVAVKCVEQNLGEALVKAHVTGQEYLKKIINLPVCLQQLNSHQKKKYMRGMVIEADETAMRTERGTSGGVLHPVQQEYRNVNKKSNANMNVIKTKTQINHSNAAVPEDRTHSCKTKEDDLTDGRQHIVNKIFSHKDFLMFCRQCFQTDDVINECIIGNPRNMKRIFNVLSLTTKVIQCFEKQIRCQQVLENLAGRDAAAIDKPIVYGRSEFHAKVLVRWILLTEQWPYRTSLILSVMHHEGENKSLYEVYKNKVELSKPQNEQSELISMDLDRNVFERFLENTSFITVKLATVLMSFTTNLDVSLQAEIVQQKLL